MCFIFICCKSRLTNRSGPCVLLSLDSFSASSQVYWVRQITHCCLPGKELIGQNSAGMKSIKNMQYPAYLCLTSTFMAITRSLKHLDTDHLKFRVLILYQWSHSCRQSACRSVEFMDAAIAVVHEMHYKNITCKF